MRLELEFLEYVWRILADSIHELGNAAQQRTALGLRVLQGLQRLEGLGRKIFLSRAPFP